MKLCLETNHIIISVERLYNWLFIYKLITIKIHYFHTQKSQSKIYLIYKFIINTNYYQVFYNNLNIARVMP